MAALLSDSVPSFVLAYLLIIVFSVQLGLLPVAGTGGWEHRILPILTLARATTASLMRLTRSSMLEVLGEDYVRTARAMGLPSYAVVFKHALKNALIPVVTVAALVFAGFVTGTVIVETIFAWPGVGKFVVDGRGTSPSTARALIVLPQPDSPTTATVSPGKTSKLTSFTARTVPSGVANSTQRSATDRTGSRLSDCPGVGLSAPDVRGEGAAAGRPWAWSPLTVARSYSHLISACDTY